MPRVDILKRSAIERTPRVRQVEGLFDVPPSKSSEVAFSVDLPLVDRPWQIGLIVGPSGSGKTSIARELFPGELVTGFSWPETKSLLDGFPATMGVKDVCAILSSVGFSSPPSWLRPFSCLSNGEQFRVTVARALAEQPALVVIDEFTSVVDRTVAKIASSAIEKAIRRDDARRLVAVSCHYDVLEWLRPDWVLDTLDRSFQWRELQPRPPISVEVVRVSRKAWEIFRHHHYLSSSLHQGAACFMALVEGKPAAFTAVLSFPHPTNPGWREHRTVCLPDFQGVGLGNAMSEFVAGVFRARGKPYFSTTSHPGMIRHRTRSPLWRVKRAPGLVRQHNAVTITGMRATSSDNRFTAGFEYVGPIRPKEAAALGVVSA